MEDKALLSTEVASGAEKAELLIVIPAYNEAENIERVVNHLTANFPQYDYVVVNDGSRDETAAICQRNGYNLLNLPVNLGLAGAFQALAGDILSSLIVVKLPFPVPDPVMEYQRNLYEDFDLYRRDIIIPEMLIKLRQWFGRGIRREKDTAVFSILDSRASLRGRYRAEILNTLPTMPVTDRLMDVADFIIRKKADSYFMDKEREEE